MNFKYFRCEQMFSVWPCKLTSNLNAGVKDFDLQKGVSEMQDEAELNLDVLFYTMRPNFLKSVEFNVMT